MIQKALTDKVAPAVGHAFHLVSQDLTEVKNRVDSVEHELGRLKLRIAWTERDVAFQQITEAKRTVIARGFPENFTAEDRLLTIHTAFRNAKVDPDFVDIHTGTIEQHGGTKKLATITIINFPTFTVRKNFMEDSKGRLVAWKWVKEGKYRTVTKKGENGEDIEEE